MEDDTVRDREVEKGKREGGGRRGRHSQRQRGGEGREGGTEGGGGGSGGRHCQRQRGRGSEGGREYNVIQQHTDKVCIAIQHTCNEHIERIRARTEREEGRGGGGRQSRQTDRDKETEEE